jgi:uncharacterized protein (TIGR02265 family)
MIRSYLERRTRADFLRHLLEANGVVLNDRMLGELRSRYEVDLKSLASSVPLETFVQLTKDIHSKSYPRLSYDEACNIMGYNTVIHYLDSQFGKVMKLTSKVAGFEASAQNFAISLKTIFPNSTVEVELANAQTYRIRFSGVSVPAGFVKGLMRGGVEAVFGVPDRVEVVVNSSQNFTCQCWRTVIS